jgi:hypothetical protein
MAFPMRIWRSKQEQFGLASPLPAPLLSGVLPIGARPAAAEPFLYSLF